MTKQELEKLTFEDAIEQLREEDNYITDSDTLKSFAIENIDDDNFYLAIHILEVLDENYYYYHYDYCMGTLETPSPITDKKDLEDFCD